MQFPQVKKAFKSVRKVWKRFDEDGNGTLEFEELRQCLDAMGAHMTIEDAQAMFDEVDIDHSRGLDFREFVVALALGCVLQLFPTINMYSGVDLREAEGTEDGAAAASASPSLPPASAPPAASSPMADGRRGVENPLASRSSGSPKPPSLGERGRAKSYVRTKQMTAVVQAMKTCIETFMLFDDNGDGVLQKTEVMETLKEKSKNARRHSGVGFGAASFLSQERWEAMDWDRNGSVTFREFCLSFYDWICPNGDTDLEDDDDDDDDEAGGAGVAGFRAALGVLRESDDASLADEDVEDITVLERGYSPESKSLTAASMPSADPPPAPIHSAGGQALPLSPLPPPEAPPMAPPAPPVRRAPTAPPAAPRVVPLPAEDAPE